MPLQEAQVHQVVLVLVAHQVLLVPRVVMHLLVPLVLQVHLVEMVVLLYEQYQLLQIPGIYIMDFTLDH